MKKCLCYICKTLLASMLLFCVLGCSNTILPDDNNAIAADEINTISGDYTYTPKKIKGRNLPDYSGEFVCYSLSALKHVYIAAGKGAEEFDKVYYDHSRYNKPQQKDIVMSSSVLISTEATVDRDYFLSMYEILRNQSLLVCENENAYDYNFLNAWPDKFTLRNEYVYYTSPVTRAMYFAWGTIAVERDNIPETEPDMVIPGNEYIIRMWKKDSQQSKFYYWGEVIPNNKEIAPFAIYLTCANENIEKIPDVILTALSECKIMTLEEAMLAAPTLENE